jgi:hypothetical protein
VAFVDLTYPQRCTERGQGHTKVHTTLEIGQNFHRRTWRLFAEPKHVAISREFDRHEGSLPTIQYGCPEDQFMGSNCATTKRFGVCGGGGSGSGIVVVMFTNSYLLHTYPFGLIERLVKP